MMILINGGSSSGKSAFAETLIVEQAKKEEVMAEAAGKSCAAAPENGSAPSAIFYLATMIAWDEECRERIQKHRKMREKKNFMTIECPVDLSKAEVPAGSRCLLECVSNLAANEMYRRDMERIRRMARWNGYWKGIRMIRKKCGLSGDRDK